MILKYLNNFDFKIQQQKDINYFFQKSISRMLLDDEVWLNKFRIIVNDNGKKETNL